MGCRRAAPVGRLVRLAREGDRLVPGAGRPGRGAWCCAGSPECLERALARRALVRALRHEPLVVEDLEALEGALGLGHRAGQGVGG